MWSDGEPITSDDFKYTWDQIVNGKNIYDPTGYDKIESIDTTNPKVAVVDVHGELRVVDRSCSARTTASSPRTSWRARTATSEMKNGYDWSGGPWFMKWDKGVSVTLTPNPKWYGTKPTIKKVIFKILADTAVRVPGVQVRRGLGDLPAARAVRDRIDQGWLEGTKSPVHRGHRQRRGAVDQQRQVPVRLRRRAPGGRRTRSTVTPSSPASSGTSA